MPIPIPIPVPASPPQGKFIHQQRHQQPIQQQQQQHFDEDEGEVKKIYLLQPVQKLQPQPQLKGGGYMGPPLQTHIHMPAPQVLAHQQQRQRQRAPPKQHQPASYEFGEDKSSPAAGHYNYNKHQQQSELKILPIVVIPPIAPMPPIQLPPTTQAQEPKMTLTPQFNNYVVAASDRGYKKPASHRMSSGGGGGGHSSLQDHKSFSDYNFAASAPHRDSQRIRSRMRGSRQVGRPGQADAYGLNRSAKIRHMIDEESIDDYDHNMRYTGQSSRIVNRYLNSGSAFNPTNNRRRQHSEALESGGPRPRASNNRDSQALEQQSALFDDEPTSMAEPARDSYPSSREQRQPSNSAKRFRQFSDTSEVGLVNSNLDQSRDSADRDYDDLLAYNGARQGNTNEAHDERARLAAGQAQQQQADQSGQQDTEGPTDHNRVDYRSDFGNVYYDRDSSNQNHYSNIDAPPMVRDNLRERRLYQTGGEREIFEDDEWRFDTIKSVAHADPKSSQNSTATNLTRYQTDTGLQISTTTLIPPPPSQTNTTQLPWAARL